MSAGSRYLAIDLGAGSGRVFLADLSAGRLHLDEISRFHYPASRRQGHLRWDFGGILQEIENALALAAARARHDGASIVSLGVDSWGVDYGLIDAAGGLLEDPVCYRDDRTDGVMAAVFDRMPREEIFMRTGIQFLPFNTVFQLYAQATEGLPNGANRLLMIPDLVTHALTGARTTEFSNATTTQLLNAASGDWDDEIVSRLALPRHLLPEVVHAGTRLDGLSRRARAATSLEDVAVIAVAQHDTGSAVAGTPLEPHTAYISSGTWSLVGVELRAPLINAEVARHNFTNEGGVFGTTRFLKNVMGLWILESCRTEWAAAGLDVSYDALLAEAAALEGPPALIFPDDPRFLHPARMTTALAEHLRETGQTVPDEPAAIVRVVVDSLAFRYASVVNTAERLTGQPIGAIRIVGGGSRNALLNRATANATGRTVLAGPVEATVLGNILVQAVAAGRFQSMRSAREYAGAALPVASFEPQPSGRQLDLAERYAAIESRCGGT